MLPVQDVYGGWPSSGEIDIAESRGNNDTYPLGGRNTMSSSLHWGEYDKSINIVISMLCGTNTHG